MKIQLLPEDITGNHSAYACPFHYAIGRACPNLKSFAVGTYSMNIERSNKLIDDVIIFVPAKMSSWIAKYDSKREHAIEWGLENLISVDLPLEEYCK